MDIKLVSLDSNRNVNRCNTIANYTSLLAHPHQRLASEPDSQIRSPASDSVCRPNAGMLRDDARYFERVTMPGDAADTDCP